MKKILIVEDDPDITRALTIRLKAAGYAVYTAADGLRGVSVAAQEKPDLMVLDISMPAGDGFTVAERVRELPDVPYVPTIFLTASKRPEYRQRAEELGAVAFLEKPYDANELLLAIKANLDATVS